MLSGVPKDPSWVSTTLMETPVDSWGAVSVTTFFSAALLEGAEMISSDSTGITATEEKEALS